MENQMSPAVKQNDERESAEVVAVARRRKFTASYKRRIVRETDACSNPAPSVRCCVARDCTARI